MPPPWLRLHFEASSEIINTHSRKRVCSSLQALFDVRRKVTFVAIINFSEIIVILPKVCYNEYAPSRSTTFTSTFVSKHQSQLKCRTEPSITYWKRITKFFSADFSENWYQTLIPKQYQTGWEHREYREKRSKTREISRELAQNKAKSNCGKELVSEWE